MKMLPRNSQKKEINKISKDKYKKRIALRKREKKG